MSSRNGHTDETGRLVLPCLLPGETELDTFGARDFVQLGGTRIEVIAEGYAPKTIALHAYYAKYEWHFGVNGVMKPVVVELTAE